jgi:hypothetical protein
MAAFPMPKNLIAAPSSRRSLQKSLKSWNHEYPEHRAGQRKYNRPWLDDIQAFGLMMALSYLVLGHLLLRYS